MSERGEAKAFVVVGDESLEVLAWADEDEEECDEEDATYAVVKMASGEDVFVELDEPSSFH